MPQRGNMDYTSRQGDWFVHNDIQHSINLTTRGFSMKFRRAASPLRSILLTIIIPALIFSGCATWKEETGPSADKLMRIMKQYNVLFETHSGAMGATFVEPKHLEKYHVQVDEVRERVTFSDSVMLSIVFLKDGKPVKQTHMTPEKDSDYNEAEVTMRYKLVISPSNTVGTLITKQKWVTSGNVWYLIPDLDPFLK